MRGGILLGAAMLAATTTIALASDATDLIPQEATKVTENGNVTEFDVATDPMQVSAFYHSMLPTQGYEVTQDIRTPSAISFFFSRGAHDNGSIVIRVRSGSSHIVLTLSEQ